MRSLKPIRSRRHPFVTRVGHEDEPWQRIRRLSSPAKFSWRRYLLAHGDRLDVAYLPLVIEEAAGVPLDASFAEQKRILQRCNGVFYQCADGAEARRFNRMLMDAGLIAGL